jgi:hypothetical protein
MAIHNTIPNVLWDHIMDNINPLIDFGQENGTLQPEMFQK